MRLVIQKSIPVSPQPLDRQEINNIRELYRADGIIISEWQWDSPLCMTAPFTLLFECKPSVEGVIEVHIT